MSVEDDDDTRADNLKQAATLRDQAAVAHVRGDHDGADELGRQAQELDYLDEAVKVNPKLAMPAVGAFRTLEQRERAAEARERRVNREGEALADELCAYHSRWVTHTFDASAVALTLWGLHAHALEAFDITPRLFLKSAEMRSGKTQALTLLSKVVPEPMDALNLSEAALFRILSERIVTVMHDEADATFGPKARDREDLRALLNGGWEAGAYVWRTVGKNFDVKPFPSFCPVALAGIGDLPPTIRDRSITIPMKRRRPEDRVGERFRRREVIKPPSLYSPGQRLGPRHASRVCVRRNLISPMS